MKYLRSVVFCDPVEGSRRCLALHWLINLLFAGAFCVGVGVVSLRFGTVGYGRELFVSYFRYLGIFLLNIVPVAVLFALFFLLFDRMWAAALGSGAIVLLLAFIHYFKLSFRSEALLAADVSYAFEAAQISSGYNVTLTPAILLSVAGLAAAVVFAALFMKARLGRKLIRPLLLAALMAMCALLWVFAYSSETVYDFTSNLKVEFADGTRLSEWNETDKYCCRGFLYPLIHSVSDVKTSRPEDYSKRAAEEYLSENGGSAIPEDKKVNFISVMLEAYCDFSVYDEIFAFENDPYEFFHELQSESCSGELVTNIFAGGTIDTERCYITGSTEMAEYRAGADSYAKFFAANGYKTEFCHPGYGWFYDRENVMEYLGFESTHFNDGRYRQADNDAILPDSEFFPDLLTLYAEAKSAGTPYFNFSVTYQNHGPYAADSLDDGEREFVPRGGLSEGSYNILNNYFLGIKKTDDSLRAFVEELRAEGEPVALVLFGDHKPWLGDNSSVYAELGIDLSRTDAESFYNYYNTPYVIWANDAARELLGNDFTGDGGSFSPCFLMMKLFDLCGYEGDGYMGLLRSLFHGGVDVVSIDGRFRENGVLTDKLSDSAAEALKKVKFAEYYRMKEG